MELNAEKTKIMRFRKGGGRIKKVDWRWKKLKEVKQFGYLEYTMQKNGEQEAHIRERGRKAIIVMREVWRIEKKTGKRIGKEDCNYMTQWYGR